MNRTRQAMQNGSSKIDRRFVEWIAQHIDLLLALMAGGGMVWAVLTNRLLFVPAIVSVGAVSFFMGFIASLGLSLILEILFVIQSIVFLRSVDFAVIMVEVFAYGCVAWLGYRHREQQQVEKERAFRALAHDDSVMSWAVANEVRTSLAAIRFLLFPLHQQPNAESNQPLRQATDELHRLEMMFSEMEKGNTDPPKSRKSL